MAREADGRIHIGDFRDWTLAPVALDLIITDPPYEKRYSYLYDALGLFAYEHLADGGSLVVLCGHYQLPLAITALENWLKYRWTFCLWQGDDSHARMAMGIEVMWKPALWFVKGSYPNGRGFIKDGLVSPAKQKNQHKWEQNAEFYRFFIEKLSPPGGMVCDPMAGSFQVVPIGEEAGRRVWACDIVAPSSLKVGTW